MYGVCFLQACYGIIQYFVGCPPTTANALSQAQKQWVKKQQNKGVVRQLLNFVWTNNHSQRSKDFALWSINVELTQRTLWGKPCKLPLNPTHLKVEKPF